MIVFKWIVEIFAATVAGALSIHAFQKRSQLQRSLSILTFALFVDSVCDTLVDAGYITDSLLAVTTRTAGEVLELVCLIAVAFIYLRAKEERELDEETQCLLAVSKSTAAVVIDMQSGEILFATSELEHLFGYETRGVLKGQRVEVLLPEDKREAHIAYRHAYAENPVPRPMMGLQGMKRNGELLDVIIALSPAMIDGHERAIGIVVEVPKGRLKPTQE